MRLKRLELHGFKSFAAKTVLDFGAGVVAIVGPNGSGKSNVIDAIRWLLGEREAKNLRGATADDLIFAGTTGASRVGAAQATIHFDESGDTHPDFSEVAVTRKIFRDGTSQCFINKSEVRLKDVIDFFAGARLGARGLTVVNQGNSDLFVRATDAERREMVEEILGLRQFQLKRHDAILKLKATRVNIEKVQAMVDELLPRLRLLRRQSEKWSERENISKELTDLENKYFSLKFAVLASEKNLALPKLQDIDLRIAGVSGELQELTRALAAISSAKPAALAVSEKSKARERELLARRSELERELGRVEARLELALAEKKINVDAHELAAAFYDIHSALRSAINESDAAEFKKTVLQVVARMDEIVSRGASGASASVKADLEKARGKLASELSGLENEFSGIQESNSAAAKDAAEFNERFRKAYEAVQVKKDALAAIEAGRDKINFEHERIKMREEDLRLQLRQIGREDFSGEAMLAKSESVPQDFFMTSERRMLRLRGDLAAIGAIDEALLKEAKEVEERYKFLSAQTTDLKTASENLEQLTEDLSSKIKNNFAASLHNLNDRFNNYFRLMFGGGKAKLAAVKSAPPVAEEGEEVARLEAEDKVDDIVGLSVEVHLPQKGAKGLETLSGGEKSLVSIAALFALTSVSPPPFLVLDEVDAALDEQNTRRFASLIKEFSKTTQFIVVTHNRATMEAADVLYGVTIGADGVSKLLSVKLG